MMRNLRYKKILVFFVFYLLYYSPVYCSQSLSHLIMKVKPCVIYIEVYAKKNKLIYKGTGFFINNKGDFVTNLHVFRNGTRAIVKTTSGNTYNVEKILGEDKKNDLVIASIASKKNSFPYLKVNIKIPKPGEKIIVLGNPLGLEFSVSDGIVSACRKMVNSVDIIQITAPISKGSSGSPVINLKGEVVGIVTFQLIKGQNLNFAIPAYNINEINVKKSTDFIKWANNLYLPSSKGGKSYYKTGLKYLLDKNYNKSIIFFNKALEKDPISYDAYFKLGYSYAQLGKNKRAIESFKKASKLKPDKPDPYYNMGVICGKNKKLREAISLYKQVILMDSSYFEAHYNLGLIYGYLKRYNEAIEYLEKAKKLKPDFYETYRYLGIAYVKIKDYKRAVESLKVVIRNNPDDAIAHYNLGYAFILNGNSAKALQEYKILRSLNPAMANKLFDYMYNDNKK